MKNYGIALLAFAILWPIFFLGALMYHNSLDVLKKVILFNFEDISKIEFWISFFISFLIAIGISYSLI